MTNLTNDLIADVITLLQYPENQKIVNEGQDTFRATYHDSRGIEFEFDSLDYGSHILNLHDPFDGYVMFIIRYCIKLLPAFQVENPEKVKKFKQMQKDFVNKRWLQGSYSHGHTLAEIEALPKTLSEALLKSGAMTVDELCEEYKRLMK